MLGHGFSLSHFSRLNFSLWCTLAFQGGMINAGGFLAASRFVSHVTGFATHFGTDLIEGNFESAFGMLTVPVFFLIGSMISALFIDRRTTRRKRPQYTQVIFLVGLIMITVAVMGWMNQFGTFGTAHDIRDHFNLLALLCLACGMQNAAVSTASGAIIRTTHLTGLTTDLGIGVIRSLSKHMPEEAHNMEVRKMTIRIGLIGSFTLGSAAGAFVFLRYQYLGFLAPGFISMFLTALAIIYRKRLAPQETASEARQRG